jgi:hypothetical protein
MAAIAVLDHHQSETDKPRKHTTRSKAQLRVRRSEAYWVIPGRLIRMLPEHGEPHATDYAEAATSLPPIELPGLKVIGIPQTGMVQISLVDFASNNPLRFDFHPATCSHGSIRGMRQRQ